MSYPMMERLIPDAKFKWVLTALLIVKLFRCVGFVAFYGFYIILTRICFVVTVITSQANKMFSVTFRN